jgi:putative ATP-dependent endonuclease of the OLD family
MIGKVIIRGYRTFEHLTLEPSAGMNVVVGDNEAGKSTLLEAIGLALTGRVNGRRASEELNPLWFHIGNVANYFAKLGGSDEVSPPEIEIELYVSSKSADAQRMRGVHNSLGIDSPGVRVRIKPSEEFAVEFSEYLKGPHTGVLPTEFYEVDWRDFNDQPIWRRPSGFGVSFIDSRTIRSTSGVDYHTRDILGSFLNEKERAEIAVAHRVARQEMTAKALTAVNEQLAEEGGDLHDKAIGLAMDQSARASWETGVVPQVEGVPFAMIGQGQQAAIKVALAMKRHVGFAQYVLVEEPETHLSYSGLRRLISRIERLAGDEQQTFITTHSSYVLNRLGLDNLLLLSGGVVLRVTDLSKSTVLYFKRLSGFDTLRLVLARRLVLVEGPSDEMIFERAYRDLTGANTAEAGVDVVAMGGLTFARALELCAKLNRSAVALRDNDGKSPSKLKEDLAEFLSSDRHMCVGESELGVTLESQLLSVNGSEVMRAVLGLGAEEDPASWMSKHKTDASLRVLESAHRINYPPYIVEAVELSK